MINYCINITSNIIECDIGDAGMVQGRFGYCF